LCFLLPSPDTPAREFSAFKPWIDTYRGILKENIYYVQEKPLRNTREEDRARRAEAMAITH